MEYELWNIRKCGISGLAGNNLWKSSFRTCFVQNCETNGGDLSQTLRMCGNGFATRVQKNHGQLIGSEINANIMYLRTVQATP